MSLERLEQKWHGIQLAPRLAGESGLVVSAVSPNSPASEAGIIAGDVIDLAGKSPVHTPLDLERAFIGHKDREPVDVLVRRKDKTETIKVIASKVSPDLKREADHIWQELGLRLRPVTQDQFRQTDTSYDGGLLVVSVRADGPAKLNGIRVGDVLVGLHSWKTESLDNVEYVLGNRELPRSNVKYYIVRDSEPYYGELALGQRTSKIRSASTKTGSGS